MPPYTTPLCTPIHDRGVRAGILFLAEKKGGREFTGEDEEVLVLFALQAAKAIADARAYRDEHRARANLEAPVDTSPNRRGGPGRPSAGPSPRDGGPAAHRSGLEQPCSPTWPATPRSRRPSGSPHGATAGASGPRAPAGAGAAVSPSRSRWPKRPAATPGCWTRPGIPAATRHGREPVRILVVDDDPQTLRYVRDALTAAGLRAVGHGRPPRVVPRDPRGETPPGPARPDVARDRRHQAEPAPPALVRTAVPAKNDRSREYVTTKPEFSPIDPRFPAILTRQSWI